MTKEGFARRLRELQEQDIPRLTWDTLIEVKPGSPPLTDEQQAELNAYFGRFCLPFVKNDTVVCPGCEAQVVGGLLGSFLGGGEGKTYFDWAIVHGECRCVKCGYPARALHYDLGGKGKDAVIERMTFMLPYHPHDLVVKNG